MECYALKLQTTSNNSGGQVVAWVLFSGDPTHYSIAAENFTYVNLCNVVDTYVNITPGFNYGVCKPPTQPKNLGCAICNSNGVVSTGAPINLGSGNMYEIENDYNYNYLEFTRYYNSKNYIWSHTYQRSLAYTSSTYGDFVVIKTPSQNSVTFKLISGTWTAATPDILGTLTSSGSGSSLFWYYQNESNELETYNNGGALISITKSNGQTLTMSYSTTNGQLSSVTDPFGNILTINTSIALSGCTYSPLVTSIVGVGGDTFSYNYDSSCNITKITYPDLTYKLYGYNGDPSLISVTDENGDDYLQWNYSYVTGKGNVAVKSSMGSSGLINKITPSYLSGTTAVTDALSNSQTLNITNINSTDKNSGSTTNCTNCSGLKGSAITYDTNGNPTSKVDFNSNTTTTTYTP